MLADIGLINDLVGIISALIVTLLALWENKKCLLLSGLGEHLN